MSAHGKRPPGDSGTARRIFEFDWSKTPLGPIEDWPPLLRSTVLATLAGDDAGTTRAPADPDSIEHARTELALRESEERLRIALEAGRMGTWRYDLAAGRQDWSEQQFRLFGVEPGPEPPTRELFLSMVHPDDLERVGFTDDDLLPDRGLLNSEFRIVRPDGSTRWLLAHTVVRRDAAGKAI
jgi:PAS domain-containing protein